MLKVSSLFLVVVFSLVLIGAGCSKEKSNDVPLDAPLPTVDSLIGGDDSSVNDGSTSLETPAPGAFENGTDPVEEMVVEPTTKGGQDLEDGEEESPATQVRRFDMTAKQWEFEPSTITVNEGDTVRLNITSIDVAHGFGLNVFGVNERLEPGQTTNIEFIADKKGTFTFTCNVFCGSGHGGMKGSLIVK